MFRREPDTRRVCPVCQKRLDDTRERWCDHCGADFTGSWTVEPVPIGNRAPPSFLDLLAQYVGHYVLIDLKKPGEPKPALLVSVQSEYVSISTDRRFFHIPASTV